MRVALLALAVVLLPCSASADAIGGPPGDCPPGTTPSMRGHGTWICAPRDCQEGSSCQGSTLGAGAGIFGGEPPGPSECRQIALCVYERPVSRGMPTGVDRGPAPRVQTADSVCGPDGTCERGECSRGLRCVETGEAPDEEAPPDEVEPAPEPTEPESADDEPVPTEGDRAPAEPDEDEAESPAQPTTDGGCGCSAPGRGGEAPAFAALVLALALSAGRRRAP